MYSDLGTSSMYLTAEVSEAQTDIASVQVYLLQILHPIIRRQYMHHIFHIFFFGKVYLRR